MMTMMRLRATPHAREAALANAASRDTALSATAMTASLPSCARTRIALLATTPVPTRAPTKTVPTKCVAATHAAVMCVKETHAESVRCQFLVLPSQIQTRLQPPRSLPSGATNYLPATKTSHI